MGTKNERNGNLEDYGLFQPVQKVRSAFKRKKSFARVQAELIAAQAGEDEQK